MVVSLLKCFKCRLYCICNPYTSRLFGEGAHGREVVGGPLFLVVLLVGQDGHEQLLLVVGVGLSCECGRDR